MFIKYNNGYNTGYINSDYIQYFTIYEQDTMTGVKAYTINACMYSNDSEYDLIIKEFPTKEEAEKHLKKLIEKINAE